MTKSSKSFSTKLKAFHHFVSKIVKIVLLLMRFRLKIAETKIDSQSADRKFQMSTQTIENMKAKQKTSQHRAQLNKGKRRENKILLCAARER